MENESSNQIPGSNSGCGVNEEEHYIKHSDYADDCGTWKRLSCAIQFLAWGGGEVSKVEINK